MINSLTDLFGYGTLIIHIGLLIFAFLIIFKKDQKITKFLNKYGLLLATFSAWVFSLSSLSLSILLGLEPCTLCWYQRIFLFSVTILLLVIFIKKDTKALIYPYILAVCGALVAIYHYFIQMMSNLNLAGALSTVCSIDSTIDCAINYFIYFNYITISLMSLTSFVLVIIFIKYAKH